MLLNSKPPECRCCTDSGTIGCPSTLAKPPEFDLVAYLIPMSCPTCICWRKSSILKWLLVNFDLMWPIKLHQYHFQWRFCDAPGRVSQSNDIFLHVEMLHSNWTESKTGLRYMSLPLDESNFFFALLIHLVSRQLILLLKEEFCRESVGIGESWSRETHLTGPISFPSVSCFA